MNITNKLSNLYTWGVGYGKTSHINLSWKKLDEFTDIDGLHTANYLIKTRAGDGYTIANSLRRTLLTHIPGMGVIALRIEGAHHMFDTINGVKESVMDIIMALRSLSVKPTGDDMAIFELNATGPCKVLAGDLKTIYNVKIMNPNLEICNLDIRSTFQIEILVAKYFGTVESEKHNLSAVPKDTICIDTNFNPVLKVSYTVRNITHGATGYDEIELSIVTNGSTTPDEALKEGSQLLLRNYELLINPEENEFKEKENVNEKYLEKNISDSSLGLSARVVKALLAANIHKIGDLIQYTREEIMVLDGIGKQALADIDRKLADYGLDYKMSQEGGINEQV